jgi:hypothetical protein
LSFWAESASALAGSFLVARIWQAALARQDVNEERRPDFQLYIDEFQSFLGIGGPFADALRAGPRGYASRSQSRTSTSRSCHTKCRKRSAPTPEPAWSFAAPRQTPPRSRASTRRWMPRRSIPRNQRHNLLAAPTNERLSHETDRFTGSGQNS